MINLEKLTRIRMMSSSYTVQDLNLRLVHIKIILEIKEDLFDVAKMLV